MVGGLVTTLAGPGLVVVGVAVSAAGVIGLGQSLSPWPAPVKDSELKTDGIYGIVRHPTYTGERRREGGGGGGCSSSGGCMIGLSRFVSRRVAAENMVDLSYQEEGGFGVSGRGA